MKRIEILEECKFYKSLYFNPDKEFINNVRIFNLLNDKLINFNIGRSIEKAL